MLSTRDRLVAKATAEGVARLFYNRSNLEILLNVYNAQDPSRIVRLNVEYVLEKLLILEERGFGSFWVILDERNQDRLCDLIVFAAFEEPLPWELMGWELMMTYYNEIRQLCEQANDPTIARKISPRTLDYCKRYERALSVS